MNLLITGCCGHIGSFLVKNIHKIKNIKKTIIIDNLKSTQINSLFRSKKKNNLKFYHLDVSQKNSLKRILYQCSNRVERFRKRNVVTILLQLLL